MSGKSLINDTHISKTLSWLLRHGAVKEKLPIDSEGFVSVSAILENKSLKGKCTVDDIKRVVANNDKQRFALRFSDDLLEIRANQGHSVKVDSLDLKPITTPNEVPNVIHGTYYKFWKHIKTQGISRMKRNHIHFAIGLPTDSHVISGMRKSCDLYIFIDLSKAISSGIEFYLSTNNVVLSPGNEQGFIEPKYFSKVIDATSGYPQTANEHEILGLFAKYGKILSHFRSNDGNFIILQFENEKAAKQVLKTKVYFQERLLTVKPRIVKTSGNIQEKKQTNQLDDGTLKRVTNILEQYPDFNMQIPRLLDELQLPQHEMQKKYGLLCDDLQKALSVKFHNCQACPFGSTVAGLGFKQSDVDVYIRIIFPPNIPLSSSELPAVKYTKVSKNLLYQSRLFTNIIAIPKAKTPIVKCVHKSTGVSCDFNFRNMLGVCNSQLIRYFLSLDVRLRPFMVIIKYWAKVNEISGSGKISNYGLVMLAIFFLQQKEQSILPPVSNIQLLEFLNIQEGWNGGFCPDPFILPPIRNASSIPELLCGFFKFYSKFDYSFNVISPLTGIFHPKTDFYNIEKLPQVFFNYKRMLSNNPPFCQPLKIDTAVCLQDPFELSHNILGNLVQKQLDDFQKLCKLAWDICDNALSSNTTENLLKKLFDKISLNKFVVSDKNCVFCISVGTSLSTLETDSEQTTASVLRRMWFDKINSFLVSVLSRVMFFDITVKKNLVNNKAQKLEGKSDVHDRDVIDTVKFHCIGKNNVWQARKSIVKSLNHVSENAKISGVLDNEIYISDYIVNTLTKGVKAIEPIVEFDLTYNAKINPTEAEIHLENIKSSKDSFKTMAQFLASKLPLWFEKFMKDNNKKQNKNDTKTDTNIVSENVTQIVEMTNETAKINNETVERMNESAEINSDTVEINNETLEIKNEPADINYDNVEIKNETLEMEYKTADINYEIAEIKNEILEIKNEIPEIKNKIPEINDETIEIKDETVEETVIDLTSSDSDT